MRGVVRWGEDVKNRREGVGFGKGTSEIAVVMAGSWRPKSTHNATLLDQHPQPPFEFRVRKHSAHLTSTPSTSQPQPPPIPSPSSQEDSSALPNHRAHPSKYAASWGAEPIHCPSFDSLARPPTHVPSPDYDTLPRVSCGGHCMYKTNLTQCPSHMWFPNPDTPPPHFPHPSPFSSSSSFPSFSIFPSSTSIPLHSLIPEPGAFVRIHTPTPRKPSTLKKHKIVTKAEGPSRWCCLLSSRKSTPFVVCSGLRTYLHDFCPNEQV